MGILNSKHTMGTAAVLIGLSVLLSRFMGLARDKVISWQFGAGGETDVYFAAFVVPDFLNYLLAGGYLSITLIPILSGLFKEDEEDAWRFFGCVVTYAALAVSMLAAAAWAAAPALAPLVAPGFEAEKLARLATFLRIILPAQVCFLPGACLSAVLYIRKEFTVPALTPLIYNGFILLCGILLPAAGAADGMEGFCWGVSIGALCGAFLLPLAAVRGGGMRFIPGFRHARMKEFLLLALPLMLGQSIVVLDEQFIRIFGSMAEEGAVSLLSYARRLMMVPVGVVAQAAGVASFPFLAELLARGEKESFSGAVNSALRNGMIIVFPIVLYLMAVAGPVMGFIFEGGAFSADKTEAAAPLLRIMLAAVPFWLIQQIAGRAFYAGKDTVTPVIAGTAATVLCVPLYLWLAPVFGARAIAFLTVLSMAGYALGLLALAVRRYGIGICAGLGFTALKSIGISLPAAALSWAAALFLLGAPLPGGLLLRQFAALVLSGLLFIAAWFAAARSAAPEYSAIVLSPLRRRAARFLDKKRGTGNV